MEKYAMRREVSSSAPSDGDLGATYFPGLSTNNRRQYSEQK
jgi:hypothetical protein